jgi:Cna protein B-type domain.
MTEPVKKKFSLTHLQTTLAIAASLVAVVGGLYSLRKTLTSEKELAGKGKIVLEIVDSRTSKPVGKSQVELLDSESAIISQTTSDSSGVYRKEELQAGKYVLKVQAKGYGPEIKNISVVANDTTEVKLSLTKLKSDLQEALEGTAAGLISG